VDIDFAKDQLALMLRADYMHPNGQLPAYEWNFSDVNPPVHAWATLFLFRTEAVPHASGRPGFLKRAFAKLLLNFTWWINRKDRSAKRLEGGFLGPGQHRRLRPQQGASRRRPPGAGRRNGMDGPFCQNMIEMSMELTLRRPRLHRSAAQVPGTLHVDRLGE
jgi:hypothetical protein